MSSIGYERERARRRAEQRFPAKYPGTCVNCDDPIEVGDTLRWDDEYAVHAACRSAEEQRIARQGAVCPKCFLEVALNGECGCEQ